MSHATRQARAEAAQQRAEAVLALCGVVSLRRNPLSIVPVKNWSAYITAVGARCSGMTRLLTARQKRRKRIAAAGASRLEVALTAVAAVVVAIGAAGGRLRLRKAGRGASGGRGGRVTVVWTRCMHTRSRWSRCTTDSSTTSRSSAGDAKSPFCILFR